MRGGSVIGIYTVFISHKCHQHSDEYLVRIFESMGKKNQLTALRTSDTTLQSMRGAVI